MSHSTNQPTPADPAAAAPAPPATDAGLPLRQRAEEIARAETPPPPKAALPPPPAAPTHRAASPALVKSVVGHTLHELRVHQIELEMQNEELRQTQAELAAARARYFALYDLAPVGYLTVSETGLILESNLLAAMLLGVVRNKLVKQPFSQFILPADQDSYYLFRQRLRATDAPQVCELRVVKPGRPLSWARLEGTLVLAEGVPPVNHIVLTDITERKRHEMVMAARLRLLTFAPAHTLEEVLRATLDEAEALSSSSIGFYHFLEADQKTLWLQAWSTNTTRNMCRAEGAGTHYPVDQAGVWVDCIRQRQAVVHNDFATVPQRKGMPPGHATVVRELVVPVMRGGQITAILGVGNKPTDYTAEDIQAVSALADLAWDIAENKRAEAALRASEERYQRITEVITDYIYTVRVAQGKAVETTHGPGCLAVTGYRETEFAADPFLWFRMVAVADRPLVEEQARRILTGEDLPPIEHRIVRKNGTVRWVRNTFVVRRDKSGALSAYDGLVQDITERKQAEAAQQASQLTAEQYLDIAAEIIITLNVQGNITLLNDSGHRLLGYAPGELQGKNWFDTCLPEGDRAGVRLFLEQLRTGVATTLVPHENSVLTRSGERRVISWHNTILRDEAGRFAGTLSSGEDITERRRAEAALRLKNFVFDESLAANSIADLDGVITEANAAFLRCWGYPRKEEVVGQPIRHFLANAEQAAAIATALRETGQWAGDYTAQRKDGSTFLARSLATIVRDEAGQAIGFQSSVIDVTERRQAAEALRESEGKFRTIFEQAPLGVALIDSRTGHICEVNAKFAAIAGRTCAEMTTIDWMSITHPDDVQEDLDQMARLNAGEITGFAMQKRYRRPDGSYVWIQMTIAPLTGTGQTKSRHLCMIEDITERKRAEEVLRNIQSLLAQTEKMGKVGGWEFDIATGKQTWTEAIYDIHELDYSYQPTVARGLDFYVPASRPIIEAAVRRTIEQGQPFDLELEIITAKGKGRSVHAIGRADPAGGRIYGFFQDITERKRAEEALRESELLFKALADTSPLAIYLSAGLEQRAKYINPMFVRLFGYTLEEVPTVAQWWPLAYPDATYRQRIEEEWQRKVEQAIETHLDIEPMEVLVTCKDGSHKNIEWGFKAVGHLNWAFGLDLTERKLAEARLQELLAQTQQDAHTKAELLKEVNHRVKNNLLAILGLALAEQRHAATEEQPVARRITGNLRRRIEGLLEVHQMLSAAQWAPVSVNLLAEKIIRAALAAAPASCSVTVDVAPSPVKVSPRQASNLALVFNELATNTVKYAIANRTAARVTLAATATASLIRLEYRDDGPGYPPAVLRQEQLSVGMMLVRDLTTQTLRGQLTLANDAGAVTVLEIKTEEIDRT